MEVVGSGLAREFSTIGVHAECGGRCGQEAAGSWVKEPSLSAKVFGLTLFKGSFISRSKTSRFIHWTNFSGNGEEDKVETREPGSRKWSDCCHSSPGNLPCMAV